MGLKTKSEQEALKNPILGKKRKGDRERKKKSWQASLPWITEQFDSFHTWCRSPLLWLWAGAMADLP